MIQTSFEFLKRYFSSFFLSWLAAFTLASFSHSQFIVNGLISVGAEISIAQRIGLTLYDWLGLAKGYGLFIAVGLLIAFIVAAFLIWVARKYAQRSERFLYPLAGACALAAILLSMQHLFDVVAIAGARDLGFYGQCLAGAVGGWVFYKVSKSSAEN